MYQFVVWMRARAFAASQRRRIDAVAALSVNASDNEGSSVLTVDRTDRRPSRTKPPACIVYINIQNLLQKCFNQFENLLLYTVINE